MAVQVSYHWYMKGIMGDVRRRLGDELDAAGDDMVKVAKVFLSEHNITGEHAASIRKEGSVAGQFVVGSVVAERNPSAAHLEFGHATTKGEVEQKRDVQGRFQKKARGRWADPVPHMLPARAVAVANAKKRIKAKGLL